MADSALDSGPLTESNSALNSREAALLVGAVFVVSACSIVYELLISALSSYFLGASVLHFSLTIGLFLFFMGVGSFASRYLNEHLLDKFVLIEILIGLVGGFSGLALYFAYSLTEYYYPIALILIGIISGLAGLEIPILTRLLEDRSGLKRSLSDVLTFDYVGALIASLLFPFLLVPYLGMQQTAFLVGMINGGVGLTLAFRFRHRLANGPQLIVVGSMVILLLGLGFASGFRSVGFFERYLYQDEIVHAEQSRYQRLVLTQHNKDLRLFLQGSLQFSSRDEYRYHEPLIHLPMSAISTRDHVLILGGGDGLGVRELLKYPDVQTITVVDLDPMMTDLAKNHALLRDLNGDSLRDERVRVVNGDASRFLEAESDLYNLIIIDLPDPSVLELGKLYTVEFYRLVARHLAADGIVMTQSTSPYFARKAFWSINASLNEVFSAVVPVKSYVPSFGLWGFNMAGNRPIAPEIDPQKFPADLRYLEPATVPELFNFGADIGPLPVEPNHLDNQILVRYYEESWDI